MKTVRSVKSPSKFMSLDKLEYILMNNGVSKSGIEYHVCEVSDLIASKCAKLDSGTNKKSITKKADSDNNFDRLFKIAKIIDVAPSRRTEIMTIQDMATTTTDQEFKMLIHNAYSNLNRLEMIAVNTVMVRNNLSI